MQEITDSLKTPSGTLYKTNAYLNYRITNLTSINTNEVQVISSVYGGFNCLTVFEQDRFTSVNGGSIATGEFSIKNAGYFLSALKVCVEVFSPDHQTNQENYYLNSQFHLSKYQGRSHQNGMLQTFFYADK